MIARAVARNRIVHFLLLGALVFALAPKTRTDSRVVAVSGSTIRALQQAEAARTNTRLTPAKLNEVEARTIEDEMLYREALRLSLDRDDPLVRQRLIQKLLLVVEDLGGASRAPSEEELRAYYDAHRDALRDEGKIHFVHVYAATRAGLPTTELPTSGVPAVGEPFPYPREVDLGPTALGRVYGPAFANAIAQTPPDDHGWSAPIRSTFGWHRVRIDGRTEGAPAPFEEVRGKIALDVVLARREKVVGAYLTKLASEVRIEKDGKLVDDYVPTHRVAKRADPSAED